MPPCMLVDVSTSLPSLRPASRRAHASPDIVPGRRQVPPSIPPPSWWRVDVPQRPAYMPNVSALERTMRDLAARHPHMARIVDIGDSELRARGRGGHDVLALVLGARAGDPAVPRVLHTAGDHPAETANPPALVHWAGRVLDLAAAGDPAYQAMLAARTVAVVPLVNPDGYQRVADGLDAGDQVAMWHRTNLNPDGGVDVNRNFDAFWGLGGGLDHGRRTYPGTHPASEAETQAVQGFALKFRPDAMYDWHSSGGTVLYPWGHTPDPPADIDRLRTAAEAVARVTGYTPRSSWEAWTTKTSGTAKDWAHHRLGVPALTIETGHRQHQDDTEYADTLDRALRALDLLAATVDGTSPPPLGAERLLHRAAVPEPLAVP